MTEAKTWDKISTYWSSDRSKRADVCQDFLACCPFVDYNDDDVHINTISFPKKSIYYAESAAENYCDGVLDVSKTA